MLGVALPCHGEIESRLVGTRGRAAASNLIFMSTRCRRADAVGLRMRATGETPLGRARSSRRDSSGAGLGARACRVPGAPRPARRDDAMSFSVAERAELKRGTVNAKRGRQRSHVCRSNLHIKFLGLRKQNRVGCTDGVVVESLRVRSAWTVPARLNM